MMEPKITWQPARALNLGILGKCPDLRVRDHGFNPVFVSIDMDMTSISIEKATLNDLVDTKLKVLQDEIQSILEKWQYMDIQAFLQDAKVGKIVDAEDDAVCMRNLVEKRDSFFHLRHRWDSK
jgi:hypothetical protein